MVVTSRKEGGIQHLGSLQTRPRGPLFPDVFGWGVGVSSSLQLAEEDVVKNITHWTLLGHHNSSMENGSSATPPPLDPADVPRGPCWETTVGIVRNSLCSKPLGWFGMGLFVAVFSIARVGAFPANDISLPDPHTARWQCLHCVSGPNPLTHHEATG